MKNRNLKNSMATVALVLALAFGSCKDKNAESEAAPAIVSTEGDTVHVDTANVPLDTGKTTHPIIKKNAEDGTNSAL